MSESEKGKSMDRINERLLIDKLERLSKRVDEQDRTIRKLRRDREKTREEMLTIQNTLTIAINKKAYKEDVMKSLQSKANVDDLKTLNRSVKRAMETLRDGMNEAFQEERAREEERAGE